MKKFFTYPVFIVLFLSFIGMIGFGAFVKYHYDGGKKYQFLQKPVMIIASFPMNLKMMLNKRTVNLDKIDHLTKHIKKERFRQFLKNDRNALLILPRYDNSISRSVVDIVDLNNFKVIHTYNHHVEEMNNEIKNKDNFPRLKIDHSPTRFQFIHPLLLEDGSLISQYGPIFKIDFCSNLKWINSEEIFHHSIMLDHEKNLWAGGRLISKSESVDRYSVKREFSDDSIIKINTDGKILFNKSVIELLIENNVFPKNFAFTSANLNQIDPIHLNDIEPAFNNTEYWKKGDLFISIRNQNAIIHYRPTNNKVINYIVGPFALQHDVDIISDNEIAIFNNNNFFVENTYSEVLIYNFKTKVFKKLFNDSLKSENFKTISGGLQHIFKDGSLMVDEDNHGRIILFNNKGDKEWEFVNKDKNGNIGFVSWSRVIEDEIFIKKFKSLVKNKKCLN